MQMFVHGMSHRTAPLDVRERASFLPDEIPEALDELRRDGSVAEVALLSTCNRTEFYALAPEPDVAVARQRELVHRRKGIDLTAAELTYVHLDADGVNHLFRVAGGIDSMVVGEAAILGQVKTAYETARIVESAGPVFARLFSQALHVGKRCRAETVIGVGAVSLEKSAVQVAEKVFRDLSTRRGLVVGGGDSAERLAMLLREAGMREVVFANRTRAKAEELAALHDGTVCDFDALVPEMTRADLLLTAVAAREPVVSAADLRTAAAARRGPLVVLDLGVPRNVDRTARKLENVFLYTIDDLRELVDRNVGRRCAEIPAVEAIVREETERYLRWLLSLRTTPVVVAMREEAERVRQETLQRFARGLPEEQRKALERFSNSLVNKLMHEPTVAVRECDPDTHEGLRGLHWARRLFGLDRNPETAPGPEEER